VYSDRLSVRPCNIICSCVGSVGDRDRDREGDSEVSSTKEGVSQ
jgi:hypothetical protein